ncbi:YdcF family protein [Denitratisoma sp. agr-D3]
MFLLKKLLTAWLFPPVGLALPTLAGAALLATRRRRLGIACILFGQGLLIALSLPVVATALIRSVERYPALDGTRLAQAQAIVVLGGGSHYAAPEYGGEDTVSAVSLQRVRYGAKLARDSGLPLLVTGGAVSGGRAEARSMAALLLQEFKLPVRWVEDLARDTRENARFSARQLKAAGVSRIVLVSHAYHLARAVPLFEAEGLAVVAAPTMFAVSPVGIEAWLPSTGALQDSYVALHEWAGRLLA